MKKHPLNKEKKTDRNCSQIDLSLLNDMEIIDFYVKKWSGQEHISDRTRKEYELELKSFYSTLLVLCEKSNLIKKNVRQQKILFEYGDKLIPQYQEWINKTSMEKEKKALSKSSIYRKLNIINRFLSFLSEIGGLHIPLIKNIKNPKRYQNSVDQTLSIEELKQIIGHFRDHQILYALILVLVTTGIKLQELCQTRVCDITFDDDEYWLFIRKTSGEKQRKVLILPQVFDAISKFRSRRRLSFNIDVIDESPLFTTATGNSYNYRYLGAYLSRRISNSPLDFIKQRNSPITSSTFRDSYTKIFISYTDDLLLLKESLGLNKISTTIKSLHQKNVNLNI